MIFGFIVRGRAQSYLKLGSFEQAYNDLYRLLDFYIDEVNDDYCKAINDWFIENYLKTAIYKETPNDIVNFSGDLLPFAEEAAKKVLQILKHSKEISTADRERFAAVVYANLAKLYLIEKDANGFYSLRDESIAGIMKCKKYCGIVGSFTDIRYGGGAMGDFAMIYLKTITPWRVVNGSRNGDPVDVNMNIMTNDIIAQGMFDFI